MKRRYSDTELIEAVRTSTAIRQVLAKLGLVEAGGNYAIIQLDIRLENLQVLCPNCHALTTTYRGKKLAKCRGETAPS